MSEIKAVVKTETIIEKRVTWMSESGTPDIYVVLRFGRISLHGGRGHGNYIDEKDITADPDGFLEFAKQVHEIMTVQMVKDRVSGNDV